MARVLKKPEEIKVTSNIKGVPVHLTRAGKQEKITAIYDRWEEEPEKNYFKVKTSRGAWLRYFPRCAKPSLVPS